MNLGSVSLRCWPEVLLCADVVQVGNDIKRSSPLISAGILSLEGLCCSHLALLRQVTSALIALIHAADAQLTLVTGEAYKGRKLSK